MTKTMAKSFGPDFFFFFLPDALIPLFTEHDPSKFKPTSSCRVPIEVQPPLGFRALVVSGCQEN